MDVSQSIKLAPDITRHKVAFCNYVTLPLYTNFPVKMGTKISGLIHIELKHFLRTERRVRSTHGIYEATANKPFNMLLISFSTVEKKFREGMDTSYAKRSSVIHLAVSSTMAPGLCEFLKLMVD